MGSVTLFNATRMKDIEDTTVVAGFVDINGHLLLQKRNGDTIDAGLVKGTIGVDGKSAYEVWLDDGNVGTVDDFLEAITGPQGPQGEMGDAVVRSVGEYFEQPASIAIPPYALVRNGQAVSRTLYGSLFAKIGTTFGPGDGVTTFNVPDDTVPNRPLGTVQRLDAAGVGYTLPGTTSANYGDIPGLTLTADSDGSEVQIDWDLWLVNAGSGSNRIANLRLLCDGVQVAEWANIRIPLAGGGDERYHAAGVFKHTPAAGTHTWKIQGYCPQASAVGARAGSIQVEQVAIAIPCIVATDQGSPAGVTIVDGAGDHMLGQIVEMGYDAVLPANCLEAPGVYDASLYSGLAALYPSWVSGSNLVVPDLTGANLRRDSMTRIVPASLANSGGSVSVDAFGRVTFTGVSSVSLNGVFTSEFKNYLVVWNIDSQGADSGTRFWFRSGGVDDTTGYAGSYAETTGGGAWTMSADVARLGRGSSGGAAGEATFFNPAVASAVTRARGGSMDNSGFVSIAGTRHNVAKVHDGFTIYATSTTFTGTVEVYGIGPAAALTRKIVIAADGAGEWSPTVQAALTSSIIDLDNRLDRGWERHAAASVNSNGSTATIDPSSGIVTVPAGCTAVRLNGLLDEAYEYEIILELAVQSGHATDNSAFIRMVEAGVINTASAYNTAGVWAQYNATWGTYSVSGGQAAAIGNVSGASSYVECTIQLRLRVNKLNGFSTSGSWFYLFDSFTGGSARGVRGGGYTPAATTAFDGILFFFNSAGTGMARGKIHVFRRRINL